MRWYLVYRSFRTEQRDFAAFRRWIIRAAAGHSVFERIGSGSRQENASKQKTAGGKTSNKARR
jgi:ferric-dicitrate binding protein FerR (iron transport regulator)